MGATPVLGGLSRPKRHSAAFGAPGVAPTFCRGRLGPPETGSGSREIHFMRKANGANC